MQKIQSNSSKQSYLANTQTHQVTHASKVSNDFQTNGSHLTVHGNSS